MKRSRLQQHRQRTVMTPTTDTIPLPSNSSDGDQSTWPNDTTQARKPNDLYYHEALVRLCPELLPPGTGPGTGKAVRFERMPAGYETFLKPRIDSKHSDRYLYGHPKGKFDSPNKFADHFKWLMGGQQGVCTCINCKKGSKSAIQRATRAPGSFRAVAVAKPVLTQEPIVPVTHTSSEQVKNTQKYLDLTYSKYQDKKQPVALEFTRGEPEGWQYRIFNQAEKYHHPALNANSFEPRDNEVVLFYSENLGLYFDEKSQVIRQLEPDGDLGLAPKWQAGRILTTPAPASLTVDDLKYWRTDPTNESKFFTVEVIPTGGTRNQPQICKLPLMNFRPFSMVAELLHGLGQKEWENNIFHAGILSTGVGLVDPCAVWRLPYNPPDITFDLNTEMSDYTYVMFQCRQMWIGPEKVVQGDVVRLMPESGSFAIQNALLVKSLGYRVLNLENADPDCDAYLYGRHITTKAPNIPGAKPFVTAKATYYDLELMGLPKSMRGYDWYDVNGERDENYSVSPGKVVGRCYEKAAMQVMIWAGDLDIGWKGVTAIRKWARKHSDYAGFVWTAPKDEKGVRFHLDDRIEIGAGPKKVFVAKEAIPKDDDGILAAHVYRIESEKSRAFSDRTKVEQVNKISMVSDRKQHDEDSVFDTFMREALESTQPGSRRGSNGMTKEEDESARKIQRQPKKLRRD